MSRAIALSIFSGILFGLSFPPFNLTYLIWGSLFPILIFTESVNGHNFWRGWMSGFIGNLIVFSWLWATFQAAQIGVIQTIMCWILLAAILGIYWGIFLSLMPFWGDGWPRILGGAALWVSLDYIRGHIFSGFPWALMAHTQAFHPTLLQIAEFTGAEGVTYLILMVNLSLGQIFQNLIHGTKSSILRSSLKYVLVPALVLGMVLFFGRFQIPREINSTRDVKVALLQGNIDQYEKWTAEYEDGIRQRYEDLAKTVGKENFGKADVIIWPESAVPGWYPNDKKYVDWVKMLAESTQTPQLIGAVSADRVGDTNSAYLVDANGQVLHRYDKQHLVPFGEYLPFGKFLSRWIPYVGQLGTFKKGHQPVLFKIQDVNFAPNICYEAVFPDLVRKSVRMGGDVIVNITNDGWYLDTGAPQQHFVSNIFRAIENRRTVVRVANTGISGLIDPWGRVSQKLELNRSGIIQAVIRLPDVFSSRTFFTRMGPLFSWACLALSLVGVALGIKIRPRKSI